ncbi:MAG TPA: polyprenyl synthetase family protein [Candidatus Moranbacteria bacterium]|nr:polyprenyl synthetase family protein [Candidatus Moranbacteria bacterium]
MEAIELLKKYKKRLDISLGKYFDKKIKEAGKSHKLAKEAVKMIADFTLADGKRIRPAMLYYAYLANGEKDCNKILEVSQSIELTHTFLLIHDDIIDKDERRHGTPTIHERYKKIGRRIAPEKDVAHFGNSMAMLAGDMTQAMANEIIFNSQFSPQTIVKALDKLQEIIYHIVPGEMMDVVMEIKGKATEKEILEMYEGKTSSYSFEGPLHLGTILAGKYDDKMLKNYTQYAMPMGKAFQIRDDILGIFGNEKKLGKPVGSDIIEGKQTLLVIKALEFGSAEQKNIVKKYLGKEDITKKELEAFRAVIKETGSLEYCQKLSEKFIEEALASLEKINIKNEEAKFFLRGIAEYMVKREV